MNTLENLPTHDEQQAGEAEQVEIDAPQLLGAQTKGDELSVITRTLIEAAPMGAAGSVFEQNPGAVITILNNSLKEPSERADEILLLPVLVTELDSSSDMISLHLRARLENPEVQNGDKQEALALLVYTALCSFSGDRLYSSYAFNHLAGAVASGEISHERLEDEVTELAKRAGYTDEQKDAFLQLAEERSHAYSHDAKVLLRDVAKADFLRPGVSHEAKLHKLFEEAETREEVLELAKDIVSNTKMLRFTRATLVRKIYLDKKTELSERHRLQERLQTLADVGSKLIVTNPETFLAEHLISYNAGEWDLCAQVVAFRDVMGDRQVAAILRTAANEELFQEQALKMMIEVAFHNPDNSLLAETLGDMIKNHDVDDGYVQMLAEQVLGDKKVAEQLLTRVSADTGRGVFTVLPIIDHARSEDISYKLHEKYYQEQVLESLKFLSDYGIELPKEKEADFANNVGRWLYNNRNIDTNDFLEKYDLAFDGNYYTNMDSRNRGTAEYFTQMVEKTIKTDMLVINELANRLPREQSERLLACSDLLCRRWINDRLFEWGSNAPPTLSLPFPGYFGAFIQDRELLGKVVPPTPAKAAKRTQIFEGEINSKESLVAAISPLPTRITRYFLHYDYQNHYGDSRLWDIKSGKSEEDVETERKHFLSYLDTHPLDFVPIAIKGHIKGHSCLASDLTERLLEENNQAADEALTALYIAFGWQENIFNLFKEKRLDILKTTYESGQYNSLHNRHNLVRLFGEPKDDGDKED
ncbi:MAG: hypothetical protein Q8Q05_00990 [bacterium]|nr:hypothetical protein [bacterium]